MTTLVEKNQQINFAISCHMTSATSCFRNASDELEDQDRFPEADLINAFIRISREDPAYVLRLAEVAVLPDSAVEALYHLEAVVGLQKELVKNQSMFTANKKIADLHLVSKVSE